MPGCFPGRSPSARPKSTARRQRAAQKRYYRFYKCPRCGVTTRVPKGKGKIRITCPRCGESFVRQS